MPLEACARSLFQTLLNEDEIVHHFLPGPGPFRTGFVTINENGAPIAHYEQGATWSEPECTKFYKRLASVVPSLAPTTVVLAGSLPPGFSPDFFARVVRLFRSRGTPVVLDAVGDALTAGLDAGASFVKINRDEFVQTFGRVPVTPPEYAQALHQLTEERQLSGCGVTDGSGAAYFLIEGRLFCAKPPLIQVQNPVGSGDSLLAGWLHSAGLDLSLEERIRWAVAAGTANAENLAVAQICPKRVRALHKSVVLEEMMLPS